MQKELKPCPFCGGETKLAKHNIVALDVTYYQAYCTSCGAERPVNKFFTVEEAIEYWNEREQMGVTMTITKEIAQEIYYNGQMCGFRSLTDIRNGGK